jgi:hypothetical protein
MRVLPAMGFHASMCGSGPKMSVTRRTGSARCRGDNATLSRRSIGARNVEAVSIRPQRAEWRGITVALPTPDGHRREHRGQPAALAGPHVFSSST